MKSIKMEVLIDKGNFSKSEDWKRIESEIKRTVSSIEWPKGSGSFTIHAQSGSKALVPKQLLDITLSSATHIHNPLMPRPIR